MKTPFGLKKEITLIALALSGLAYSQVGINNTTPKATLDVTAKTTDGTKPEGIIAPRLTGDQIKSANGQYTTTQQGAIVYATSAISSADATGKASNITADGYYYFDGSVWQKMSANNPYASNFSNIPIHILANSWTNSGVSLTVPESGIYFVTYSARAWLDVGYIAGDFWKARLMRSSDSSTFGDVFGMHANGNGNNGDTTSSFSTVMYLNKNESISLWYYGQSSLFCVGDTNGGSSIVIFKLM